MFKKKENKAKEKMEAENMDLNQHVEEVHVEKVDEGIGPDQLQSIGEIDGLVDMGDVDLLMGE